MKQKNIMEAHKSCVWDISFSSSSMKFCSCSDDATAKVFDFVTSKLEMTFTEHQSDVKSCDWHPSQSLILTGSKD